MRSKNPRCKKKISYKVVWPDKKKPFYVCYDCHSKIYFYSLTVKITYHWSYVPKVILKILGISKCESYKIIN
jgi:hypothetical protein